MRRDGFPDTLPMLYLADAPTMAEIEAQRFRDHEGEVDDEHDAARDYEAEAGRYGPPRMTRTGWALLAIVLGSLIAAMIITAHPCDIDGTHDTACGVTR